MKNKAMDIGGSLLFILGIIALGAALTYATSPAPTGTASISGASLAGITMLFGGWKLMKASGK